jgi:hypothetical protein
LGGFAHSHTSVPLAYMALLVLSSARHQRMVMS